MRNKLAATEETLAFVGGNITLNGTDILTPGLKVELGTLKETGTIEINEDGSFNFPDNVAQGNISLRNNSRINVVNDGGGSIAINGENLTLTENSILIAGIATNSNNSEAQAGDINIDINNDTNLSDNSLIANSVIENGTGNGGNINIKTNSLALNNTSTITGNTFGIGNSGAIIINANDIIFNGNQTFIASGVNENAVGNGGEIKITTDSLSLTEGALLASSTFGQGNAGPISIEANALTLTNDTAIDSSTFGQGNGGKININAQDIVLNESRINSQGGENAVGNAGPIEITTGSLNAINGSAVFNGTLGKGDAADITINAEDRVRITGARDFEAAGVLGITSGIFTTLISSQVLPGSQGNGGKISISAKSLTIEDGGLISTVNSGDGIGGDINLNIRENILLQGFTPLKFNNLELNVPSTIQSATGSFGLFGVETSGKAGNINIKANSLFLKDSSFITSFTLAKENAGNISIQTNDLVSLDNSAIGTSVSPGAEGNGGNIDIQTRTLNLTAGGLIDAAVIRASELLNLPGGIGEGGNIRINATESVNISGFTEEESTIFNPFNPTQTESIGLESSGIVVSTQAGAIGKAGTITINTDVLNLTDGGIIEALTDNSSAGGDIQINVSSLNAINGGQVIASTLSDGKAGDITINSTDRINLTGNDSTFTERQAKRPDVITNQGADSGIFANTTNDSTGAGGSIFISNPQQLTISDGAKITVNSLGQGNGGEVLISTDSASLNQGLISASTESGEGGNITLELDDSLLMSNQSTISARAANDANGGNTNINAELVIAFTNQNNDIIANAERGRGGNINITTEALFGIEERPLNPLTNDINASSEFGLQGNIAINTPEVDPTSGLVELPQAVRDPSDQISQNPCEQGVGSEFIITGKGGLPANPNENFNSDRIRVGLVEPVPSGQPLANGIRPTNMTPETSTPKAVPAMGWIFNDRGEVTLTAYPTTGTEIQRSPQQLSSACSASSSLRE